MKETPESRHPEAPEKSPRWNIFSQQRMKSRLQWRHLRPTYRTKGPQPPTLDFTSRTQSSATPGNSMWKATRTFPGMCKRSMSLPC